MSKEIRLKKGLNINLSGVADKIFASIKPTDKSSRYVVKPTDFHSLNPKLAVKVGDKVKAGTVLFLTNLMRKSSFVAQLVVKY